MRTIVVFISGLLLSGCMSPGAGTARNVPRPGLGQYTQPAHLRPEPTPRIPLDDVCRSRLFLGLVGKHEGAIEFAYLPVRTRVVKPAELEIDQDDFLQDMQPEPPFLQVREYIPGQVLYGPSIEAVRRADELGPILQDRLTIELDKEGYVTRLSCR